MSKCGKFGWPIGESEDRYKLLLFVIPIFHNSLMKNKGKFRGHFDKERDLNFALVYSSLDNNIASKFSAIH